MKTKVLKRLGKEEKGFTLIELLAVIVILAVIAAIAIPLIGSIINKSKTDSDVSTARQIYDAARIYITSEANGDFVSKSVSVETLQAQKYLDANIILPSTKNPLDAKNSVVVFDSTGALKTVTVDDNTTDTAGTKTYSADEVLSVEDKPNKTS